MLPAYLILNVSRSNMEKKLNSFLLSSFIIALLSVSLLPIFLLLGKVQENALHQNPLSEIVAVRERNECFLEETASRGTEYLSKLIFLGESTTYGLQRYGVLPGGQDTCQVWTGALCTADGVRCAGTLSLSPVIAQSKLYYPDDGRALTVFEAVQAKDPQYLVITLGLNNGASYYSESEFKECYRILLNEIFAASKTVNVILQSIFPVAATCKITAYTPERIALCNTWVQDIAIEYSAKYLDTFEILTDEKGYLKAEYENGGDGIHLNEAGLCAVLSYIQTHVHPNEALT